MIYGQLLRLNLNGTLGFLSDLFFTLSQQLPQCNFVQVERMKNKIDLGGIERTSILCKHDVVLREEKNLTIIYAGISFFFL